MITYFNTQQVVMVSQVIGKEACDLIKRNPSQQNQRSPENSQRSTARMWARIFPNLLAPAWRDPGTKRRNGREEWGR